MPQGLQVFNSNGSLRDDVTTRFARIVRREYIPLTLLDANNEGVFVKEISKGSFIEPQIANWSPFYFFTKGEYMPMFCPDVIISETTVSWEFYPMAEEATFTESGLIPYKKINGKGYFIVGGFWLNLGVY